MDEPEASRYYGRVQEAPIPLDATLCRYGRFGGFGRAVHDGWLSIVKPPQVVTGLIATGIFSVLFAALIKHPTTVDRVLLVIPGALCAVAVVVGLGAIWALTPWGRKVHWRSVIHPFTAGGDGCSLVGHHWHEITNMWCEVRSPDRNKTEYPIPWPARPQDDERIVIPPRMKCDSFAIFGFSTPGRYRFLWKVNPVGCNHTVTVAKGRFRIKKP